MRATGTDERLTRTIYTSIKNTKTYKNVQSKPPIIWNVLKTAWTKVKIAEFDAF